MLSNDKGTLLIALGYSDGSQIEKETCFVQMGILYLATVLKNNNYKVKVLFSDYPDIYEIIDLIKNEYISTVGFYTSTENITRVLRAVKIIKSNYPAVKVILGGPHGSVMDREIMEKEDTVDVIVRKEGENTLFELIKHFHENTGSLEDISGITYRKSGMVVQNPDRSFADNLDTLPIPDRDLLEGTIRKFDILYPRIITGRGCPFKCAFCYEGFSGSSYRMRSAENVLSEIDYLLNRGDVRYIRFLDDTFTVNPSRTIKICRGLRERSEEGKKFVWFAEGRVDVLAKYPKLIYEMSFAGLANIQLGVECADNGILSIYQKNITVEQIEHVVNICHNALIPSISINFILGGSFDSPEIYNKNIEFIKKLMKIAPGRLNVTSSLLAPFPGTAIKREPEKFGLKIIDMELNTGMTNEMAFCETEAFNKYDLINLKRDFERQVEKIMAETSKDVSTHTMSQIFSLQFYGIASPWYYLFSQDIGIKRFFNLSYHSANARPSDVADDYINNYYPLRTYPLNYDKNDLIVFNKIYGEEKLNFTDSRLYELSSGKRSFEEIVEFAKEKFFHDMEEDNVFKIVKDFYLRMENFYAVIFSKI